jgi:addiction module RelB/DinJ family antitoxin
MAKSATARARVEPEVKREAEKILSDCGLTASQAISLFYRQVILERGMPFQIKSFNEQARRVPPLRGWGFRSGSPPWR